MPVSKIVSFDLAHLNEAEAYAASDMAVVTSPIKSPGRALRINPATAQARFATIRDRAAGGTFRDFAQSVRLYFQLGVLPSAEIPVFTIHTAAGSQYQRLMMQATGALKIIDAGGTNRGASSNTLSVDGEYHRIDFDCGYNNGLGIRVLVDGVEWVSSSIATVNLGGQVRVGWQTAGIATAYYDDIVFYDTELQYYDKLVAHYDRSYVTQVDVGQNSFGFQTHRAQRFSHPGGEIKEIILPMFKTGSPADNIVVGLYTDSGGLPSGTRIGSEITIAASTLTATTAATAQRLRFPVDAGVQSAGNYWIVVNRSGANNTTNYFSVLSSGSNSYSDGFPAVYSGSWAADTNDLSFEVNSSTVVLGDYENILLKPIKDVSVSGWKRQDGSTTTLLYEAVNNTPPTATTGTSGATRVENALIPANDHLELQCEPYSGFVSIADVNSSAAVGQVAANTKRGQTFTIPSGITKIRGVWVKLNRVGTVTDDFVVKLYTDAGTAPGGTLLGSASITGSTLPAGVGTGVKFDFGSDIPVIPGNSYWLVFERTGATGANYYEMYGSAASVYSGGQAKLHDGSTWSGLTLDMGVFVYAAEDTYDIMAVQSIVNHAQSVTTASPKEGSTNVVSNPSGPSARNFDFGFPSGNGVTTATAMGTYPTGWGTAYGPAVETPGSGSVTDSDGPTIRGTKVTGTAHEVNFSFMGAYVMRKLNTKTAGLDVLKHKAGTFNATTGNLALGSAPAVGSKLVVVLAIAASAGSAVPTDLTGYTAHPSNPFVLNNNNNRKFHVYTKVADGTETNVAVTLSAATRTGIHFWELESDADLSTLAVSEVGSTGSTATSSTTGSIDPTATVDTAFLATAVFTADPVTVPVVSDDFADILVDSTRRSASAHKVVNNAGSTSTTFSWTGGTAVQHSTLLLAISATSPPPSITRPKIRVGGSFVTKPKKIKIGGVWVEKQEKIKIGGVWVNI